MFKKMKEQKLKKQIKSFFYLKDLKDFAINENTSTSLWNIESYDFIEENKELNVWEYGDVNRGSRFVSATFEKFEEVLLYLVYQNYGCKKEIEIRGEYIYLINTVPHEERLDFILKVANENNLDMDELKIKNENELIYNDRYIIRRKKKFEIYEEYMQYLFRIKAYNIVKKELIDFGIDREIVEKHFKFEVMCEVELKNMSDLRMIV